MNHIHTHTHTLSLYVCMSTYSDIHIHLHICIYVYVYCIDIFIYATPKNLPFLCSLQQCTLSWLNHGTAFYRFACLHIAYLPRHISHYHQKTQETPLCVLFRKCRMILSKSDVIEDHTAHCLPSQTYSTLHYRPKHCECMRFLLFGRMLVNKNSVNEGSGCDHHHQNRHHCRSMSDYVG